MSGSIEDFLASTLDDGRMSRGETQALRSVLDDLGLAEKTRASLRQTIFKLARDAVANGKPFADVLGWTEAALKLVETQDECPIAASSEAIFAPDDGCWRRIIAVIDGARQSADICVFTITDDRIADALTSAHQRGVGVRIVTDDEKSGDLGSDIAAFESAGIPVAVDRGGHMHHKFAIIDGRRLLSGSYNWTRGAADANHENIIVTDDVQLVRAFAQEFERLWQRYG